MNEPDLNARVEAAHERVMELVARAEAPNEDLRAALREVVHDLASSVEELAAAAEELQVDEEELRQQNEELILARADLESERARYLDLFEFAPEPYLVTDPTGLIIEGNQPASALFHVPHDRLVGKPLTVFSAEGCAGDLMGRLHTIGTVREPERWEVKLKARAGKPFTAAAMVLPVRDASDQVVAVRWAMRDISERQRVVEEIERSARVQAVAAEMTEIALRAASPAQLFADACRIAVSTGQFKMAWVGLVDEAGHTVQPVAQCGFEEGYLGSIRISTDVEAEGLGPTGTAARTGRADLCHDFATDPRMTPWREQALERGYASSGAFPLRADGRVFGVLTVYAAEPGFFGEQETRLLEGLAADISLAVRTIEAQQELQRHRDHLEALVAERTAQLSEQERLYRTIVTTANEGIWMCDAQWRTIFVNERYAEITGYTVEELMALPAIELVAEEFREQHGRAREQRQQGKPQQYDSPVRCKDGATRWTLVKAAPLLDAEGNFAGSLCLVTDITARRQADEERERLRAAAQSQAAELDAILETIADALIVYDADSRVVRFNDAARRMYGLSDSDIGKTLQERIAATRAKWPSGEISTLEQSPVFRALNGETVSGMVMVLTDPDGQEISGVLSSAPLRHADGTLAGAVVSVADISRIVLAEREAQGRATELDSIISTIADGVVVYDANGNTVRANDAARRILGWSDQEVGQPIEDRVRTYGTRLPSGEPLSLHQAPGYRAMHGETVYNFVSVVTGPDGGDLWISTSGAPLQLADGTLSGAVVTFTDITPLVTAESEAQARAAELETVIKAAPDGVIIFDANGVQVQTNDAARRIFGYSEEQEHLPVVERARLTKIRRPSGEPIAPEDLPASRALRGEAVTGVPVLATRMDGEEKHLLLSASPLHGPDGAISGAVIAAVDVSELDEQRTTAERLAAELATIIDSLDDAIVVYDNNGIITRANRTLVEVAGHDLVGMHYAENFEERGLRWADGTPLKLEEMAAHRALHGEAVHDLEFLTSARDGSDLHALTSAVPLYRDGQPYGAVAHWRDITELRRGQEERERLHRDVQTQQRTLEAILQAAPVGICLVDGEDLRVKWANDTYLTYLQQPYASEGVVGLKLTDYIPRAEEGGVAAAFRQVAATGARLDTPEFAHDGYERGTTYWRRVLCALPGEAPGKHDVLAVISETTAEVTARKRIEELAEQNRQRVTELETVIDSLDDAIVIYDNDGIITRANRNLIDVAGHDPTGMSFDANYEERNLRWLDGTRLSLEEMAGRRALQGEIVRNLEMLAAGPDGADARVLASAAPLFSNGQPNGAVAHWRDITELRRGQEERERLHREVEAQRQTLQMVIDNVSTAIVVVDGRDLRVKWNNNAYLKWQNEPYRSNGVVGLRVQDFIPQAEEGGVAGAYRSVADTGEPHYDTEFCFEHFDLGPRYFRRAFIALPGEHEGEWDVMGVLDDITDEVVARKRIEELAAQSEESRAELEAVINSMTEGLVIADTDGNITLMNQAALALHGFSSLEECRRHFEDYGHLQRVDYPDGRPMPMELWPLVRATRGEVGSDYEALITRGDAERGWLGSFSFAPVRDADGNVILGINTVRDITAQRAAEGERERLLAEVQRGNATLQALLDTMPAGVIACDVAGKFTLANRFTEIMFGGPIMGDAYGPPAPATIHSAAGDVLAPQGLPLPRALERDETTRNFEFMVRHPDGSAVIYNSSASPLHDAEGHITGAIGVIENISERKAAEREREVLAQEVSRQSAMLSGILDTTTAGLVIWDGEDLTIKWCNANWQGFLDTPLQRRDLIGTRIDDILPVTEASDPTADIRAVAATGQPRGNSEILMRWPERGDRYWSRYAVPMHRGEGQPCDVLVTVADVTEQVLTRKRIETLLDEVSLHRDHLNELVAERTAELQITNVQLAQEVAQRKTAEEQLLSHQEDLRALASDLVLSEERTRRALATGIHDEISQPLAFSRIKIGMLRQAALDDEIRESLVEVEEVLKKVIQTSRTLTFEASPPVLYQLGLDAALQWLADDMRARHVTNSHFATEGEPVPLGDDVKVMLFQAVRELLANAAKHAQAENVDVSVAWLENRVRITVADDGVGFTPPRDSEGSASGFGLFNIRERISHLGGALHIESCPGDGTTFTIVAPAAG